MPDYIDKIKLGTSLYSLQSDGVANPDDANQYKNANAVIESVNVSSKLNSITTITFLGGERVLGQTEGQWYYYEGRYRNDVSCNGLTSNSAPVMVGIIYPDGCSDAQRKAVQKASAFVCEVKPGSNIISAYATRLPATDITIAFRGISTTGAVLTVIPMSAGGGGSSLEPTGGVLSSIYIDSDGNAQACSQTLDKAYTTEAATGHGNIYLAGSSSLGESWDQLNKVSTVYISSSNVVRGAGWNDFAETREVKEIGGTCVIENGDGTMSRSTKRLQRGAAIVSDTYGMLIGPEGVKYSPIAVAGRVLARISSFDLAKFKVGQAVCSGENGQISPMSWIETVLFPDRIIGYVSEFPSYKTWNKVKTNNRIWITVR